MERRALRALPAGDESVVIGGQRVKDIGEFGLIELISAALPPQIRATSSLLLGLGDDGAVWRPTSGEDVVVTTDSLVENIHFRRDWTDWESLGHKILAVNVSDLAAMGSLPKIAVITLGLSGDELVSDLQALYRGIGDLAHRNAMTIAGGDIVRSPHSLLFHVTALGETRQRRFLVRSGAKSGDVIAVTGTLGASAAGLRLLAMQPDDPRRGATTTQALIDAHLRPEPRVALGAILLEHGATSAMDLSDGLAGDLLKILEASRVSAELDARRVPVAAAVRALFPDEWFDLALRGGEDYELLFTAPSVAWEPIARSIEDVGGTAERIGRITKRMDDASRIEIIDMRGVRRVCEFGAFDHYRDR